MKHFVRTLLGKIILFICCIVMMYATLAAVIGGLFLISTGGNAYLHSEEGYVTGLMKDMGYYDYESEEPLPAGDMSDTSDPEETAYIDSTDDGIIVDGPESREQEYRTAKVEELLHLAYGMRYTIIWLGVLAFALEVACYITLMCVSGRRPDRDELVPGPLNRVPYDLMLAVVLIIWGGTAGAVIEFCDYSDSEMLVVSIIMIVVSLNAFLGISMSTAARVKEKSLVRNTVIARLIRLIWKILKWIGKQLVRLHHFNMTIVKNIKLVWKLAIIWAGVILGEVIILSLIWADDVVITLWFIEKLIMVPLTLYIGILLTRLRTAGKLLAEGNTDCRVDTKGMFGEFKAHGEDLNNISGGIGIAVEERLKSERMKTELITNVSHDIKTPLTSIVNYGMLIGNETTENLRIKEYSEVIVKQSGRLKRLIEDLIEASKASTGNLEVCLTPCNAGMFISQICGEYEDKLEAARLSLVSSVPKDEMMILADGRRMWRIFDNLMNNICKYSLEGSRVYLSLDNQDDRAVITFKNTSRQALNMNEDELMERFVRGDSSRNTEGSGLGLSIAQSLAELQKGQMKISVDGDLFKVILTFPIVS